MQFCIAHRHLQCIELRSVSCFWELLLFRHSNGNANLNFGRFPLLWCVVDDADEVEGVEGELQYCMFLGLACQD